MCNYIVLMPFLATVDDYKEVLLKHIAPDQLPEAFGGERREPDPQCSDFVRLRDNHHSMSIHGIPIIIACNPLKMSQFV